MARFDRSIQTALRLIKKNGAAVKWRVVTDTVPDPDKPWLPGAPTTVNHDVMICFLPVNRQTYETYTFLKDTEVPSFSSIGLMGQVPFAPNLKDTVIDVDGKELRIAYIDLLAPNRQNVLYTVLFQ